MFLFFWFCKILSNIDVGDYSSLLLQTLEVATGGVLLEEVFLEILQNSHENTCARVSVLIKLQAEACNFIKKETLAQVFS